MVNRLWRAMFGRGLVEPVDDLRDTNPATHPELLDRLAADFAADGFDLRHPLRLIATSARMAAAGPRRRSQPRTIASTRTACRPRSGAGGAGRRALRRDRRAGAVQE